MKKSNLCFKKVEYVFPFSQLKKEVAETISSVKQIVDRAYSIKN